MTQTRKIMGFIIVGLAGFLLSACTMEKVALERISKADLALRQAQETESAKYASLELHTAQEKLENAKRADEKGDYEDAARLAEQSLVNAELAQEKVRNEQAQTLAQETRRGVEDLRQETHRHSNYQQSN